MLTGALKEAFLQGAEQYGWLDEKFEQIKIQSKIQERKEIAKKMLMRGYAVDDVAEIMELPLETVMNLQGELIS